MPEKRIYTREEIKQLCADMDTFAKCSDELHAAMREGRIKE